jgi:hypothetical protein
MMTIRSQVATSGIKVGERGTLGGAITRLPSRTDAHMAPAQRLMGLKVHLTCT